MPIVLVRHAETALNAARVVQPFDTPLSARGLEQASRLTQRLLLEYRPAMILSSDAPRALQTAAPLAQALAQSVSVDPMLRERDFGVLRGRAYDSLGFEPQTMTDAPEGGESLATFRARVQAAWSVVLERSAQHPEADLVVVSHGLWIRTLIEQVWADELANDPVALPNTSVTIIDAGPPSRLRIKGCAAHLGAQFGGRGISGI